MGKRYVGSPFANTSTDLFRVIASENQTIVNVEGNSNMQLLLNAGEYSDFDASNGAYIEADKPISVAQYIKGQDCNGGVGDPSMVILNTVEQIRDTVTLFNSRFEDITSNYINIICKAGEEDLIFFDGENVLGLGNSFNVLGSNGLFAYATIPTSAGAHTIYSGGCGIIAMAYGYGNVESYAYSGGASFNDINENPIPDGSCLNETIKFETGLPPGRFKVMWDLGDGNFTSDHIFEHKYPGDDTGNYNLSLIIEDICFFEIDTLYKNLKVTLRQDLTAGADQSGCEGTDIGIEANDLSGSTFEWTGPNGFISDEQFPTIKEVILESTGKYEVQGNISGCKTFPKEVEVVVFENPKPYLGNNLILCPVDGEEAILDANLYETYLWQDGSTNQTLMVSDSGLYYVDVMDENRCIGRDSRFIVQQCPTRYYLPSAFTPNGDGEHDFFGIQGIEILSMYLDVYDRWGNQVFNTRNPKEVWDGRHHGSDCAVGSYIWFLRIDGYREDASHFTDTKSGTVLLLR